MGDHWVIPAVTFTVFMTEALVHYNTGIASAHGKAFKFSIPSGDELIKLGSIVAVATIASTLLIKRLRQ